MSTTILLTINAAAEALSVSARTVRRLLDRGDLSTIRTVPISDVDQSCKKYCIERPFKLCYHSQCKAIA